MARKARFVATGCCWTNARFPVTTQQKYWDQGRSLLVLTTTCPICFARSSCATGGKARKASIFPSARSWTLGRGIIHPVEVFAGVEADIRRHDGQVDVPGRPQSLPSYADGLPLRSRIACTRSVPNSSIQPTWRPASPKDGLACLYADEERRSEVQAEVMAPVAKAFVTSPKFPLRRRTSVNPRPPGTL